MVMLRSTRSSTASSGITLLLFTSSSIASRHLEDCSGRTGEGDTGKPLAGGEDISESYYSSVLERASGSG